MENLDAALAINHPLNPALQIGQGHGIHVRAGAGRGVRIAGGTGEVAGIDNFDQAEAGGELFHDPESLAGTGIAPQGAGD